MPTSSPDSSQVIAHTHSLGTRRSPEKRMHPFRYRGAARGRGDERLPNHGHRYDRADVSGVRRAQQKPAGFQQRTARRSCVAVLHYGAEVHGAFGPVMLQAPEASISASVRSISLVWITPLRRRRSRAWRAANRADRQARSGGAGLPAASPTLSVGHQQATF
jgi:hypothetical protein